MSKDKKVIIEVVIKEFTKGKYVRQKNRYTRKSWKIHCHQSKVLGINGLSEVTL